MERRLCYIFFESIDTAKELHSLNMDKGYEQILAGHQGYLPFLAYGNNLPSILMITR